MYIEDLSSYDLIIKTRLYNIFVLYKTEFAELKMSFKDAVYKILLESRDDFRRLESRKELATDYYNINKKFEGLVLHEDKDKILRSSIFSKSTNKINLLNDELGKEEVLIRI
jgi:hypothetical protein